jgi:polygalacturonase
MGAVSKPALAASVGSVLAADLARGESLPAPADASADRGARVYNIRDFGAKGDGATLDTAAVQAAIDAAHKDDGGIVLVPAGTFVVGTLDLKSYVTLRVAAKGRLLGSGDPAHFKAGNGVPPGNGNIVLLSAANAVKVTIEGPGTIDGNGAKFYTGKGDQTGPGQNSGEGYFQRPHLVVFYKCQDVRMRDVFLTSSAYHCVRILQCQQVKFDGVRILNRVNKNNDGFHFNSCEYVHVANCDVACQDDACALFGSNKFVTVTNSTFSTRWSIFRFGGGQPENITVSNCVIYETYGCAIKISMGRGSRLENVTFSNIIMKDVTGPISVGLSSTSRRGGSAPPSTRPPGIIRNLRFEGIRASVVSEPEHCYLPWESKAWDNDRGSEKWSAIVVNAAGEDPIEGVTFSDVHVTFGGGGTAEHARREVPKIAGEYFEIGTPPAYGLYARNARGLTLENVRFETAKPDFRPAVVFDHVQDAAIHRLSAQSNEHAESLLRFTDSKDVLLTATRVLTPAAAFLRVEGPASDNIRVDGGDLVKAKQPVSTAEEVAKEAVVFRV